MSSSDVIVRTATRGDAESAGKLAIELGYPTDEAEAAERLIRVLAAPGHRVFVSESLEDGVVGWVHVFGTVRVESEPFAELGGLVVTERWRGRGVGARLVAAAEEWASDNGYPKLRIRSRAERTDAHGFFEGLGFVSSKTQRVFDRKLAGGS